MNLPAARPAPVEHLSAGVAMRAQSAAQVAHAILEGATEIALHGIGLALDSPRAEPISARACLEYWCGVAEGRGIKVTTAEDCDIFLQYHLLKSSTVYGYDDVKLIEDRHENSDHPRKGR